MGQLVYSMIASLDGFIADRDGGFEWAAPDEEVHADVNARFRSVGVQLLGRRIYEVLRAWDDPMPDATGEMLEFAEMWRGTDKIVYSTTMTVVSAPRTEVRAAFDPDEVRTLVRNSASDVTIGGPELAALALAGGLVDELRLYSHPIVVGGGKHWLPAGVRLELELLEQQRFSSGVQFVRYAVR